VHDSLKELRAVVDEFPGDPVLVTEAAEPNIIELSKMYGKNLDEVQLPMNFQIADVNELSAPKFRKLLDEADNNPAGGQPEYFFGNHDQDRQWDRYGDGKNNDQIAKLMAALLLLPRATPQMYYGEELGMRTTPPARVEDVHDPIGKKGWPEEKGRDGERTPMQWDASKNAGFTTAAKSWLWIPANASQVNVAVESKDPNSILNWYKKLLALRKSNVAIRDGKYITVNPDDPNVLSFLRQSGSETVLVALNMSAQAQTVKYNLSAHGAKQAEGRVLLASPGLPSGSVSLNKVTIPPFGTAIVEVE
jgi:alpha-glucosidase